MCLLELLAVLLAHRHHGRHVHLVEGGEDGILVLRLKQALGNAGAQSGHRHTLLGTLAVDHLGGRGALRLGRGSVLLGDAAAATRTCHVVGSDAFLGEDLARCRAGGAFGSSRCRGCRCRCRCGCCGGRGCGRLLRRGRAPAAALASVSIWAISSPEVTLSPPCLTIFTSTPSAGAGVSNTTLSVSISMRFSSRKQRRLPSCAS